MKRLFSPLSSSHIRSRYYSELPSCNSVSRSHSLRRRRRHARDAKSHLSPPSAQSRNWMKIYSSLVVLSLPLSFSLSCKLPSLLHRDLSATVSITCRIIRPPSSSSSATAYVNHCWISPPPLIPSGGGGGGGGGETPEAVWHTHPQGVERRRRRERAAFLCLSLTDSTGWPEVHDASAEKRETHPLVTLATRWDDEETA